MSKSRRINKRRRSGAPGFISTAALVIIAILLVIFVYTYIRNNSFTKGFSKISVFPSDIKQTVTQSEAGSVAEDGYGLMEQDKDRLIYILSDDEAEKYGDDHIAELDGRRLLCSSWLEDGMNLYYFDENGCAVSELSESAMDFEFDRHHVLTDISYNKNYRNYKSETEYPGVVQTKTLWAFQDNKEDSAGLLTVKYKKTTESFAHVLGGDADPQYTSAYAVSIADGYIYYIAFTDKGDKLLEPIANKLFRMKPGEKYRELAAENVRGYKVIEGKDGAHVYYSDGHGIKRAVKFEKDETLKSFPEDGSYYVEIKDGKAVLMAEGGYPVAMPSSSFKAGNFVYSLSASGEITNVEAKNKIIYGGYTYSIENGEAFGAKKARVIREALGSKEVISSEFDGNTGNLHFDFDSSKIIAEYTDAHGAAGLISISLDGDIDMLYDAQDAGSKCVLYAINDGYAIAKTDNTLEPFIKARIASSYPLAVGIDPVALDETDGSGDQEPDIQETTQHETVSALPEHNEVVTGIQPGGNAEHNGTAAIIPDGADIRVEKKGPGSM